MYNKAVELYRQFIATYPESDYVYEFTSSQGEALFYSERYREAIVQYKWVRDHRDLGTDVLPRRRALGAAVVRGRGARRKSPRASSSRSRSRRSPSSRRCRSRGSRSRSRRSTSSCRPSTTTTRTSSRTRRPRRSQGINAALISLAYLHVDDAIARFHEGDGQVLPAPPAKKGELAPAAKAKDGILAIYEAQANFDAIEATNKRFINAKCGDDNAIQLAINQNRSLNFSRAAELYKNQQYIPAAEAFYRFYKTAPADRSGSAGRALQRRGQLQARRSAEDGDRAVQGVHGATRARTFRESPYYLDAMRLTAAS